MTRLLHVVALAAFVFLPTLASASETTCVPLAEDLAARAALCVDPAVEACAYAEPPVGAVVLGVSVDGNACDGAAETLRNGPGGLDCFRANGGEVWCCQYYSNGVKHCWAKLGRSFST
jgi:hypothetical protein